MFSPVIVKKLALICCLVPIGLLSKVYSGLGNEFVTNYFGGIIYVVFFIVLTSILFPKVSPFFISVIVFTVTCILEFSQLIQLDVLNRFRQYFIVRALIGNVFNLHDFAFYFIGSISGYFILFSLKDKN